MSVIGNNIKKIRSIKKLNQQAFADMFAIKRASVGAYEEGRADPKIKTIIEIANKFGISLDLFITKELKVNDLYRFDLFREDLAGSAKHNLNPSQSGGDLLSVPFVNRGVTREYYGEKDEVKRLKELPSIQVPLNRGKNYRAFEVPDHYMQSSVGGILEGDIVIGESPKGFDVSQMEAGKVYLLEFADHYVLRKVIAKNMSQIKLIGESSNSYVEEVNTKDVQKVWQVARLITKNIRHTSLVNDELKTLQEEIRVLKLKLK